MGAAGVSRARPDAWTATSNQFATPKIKPSNITRFFCSACRDLLATEFRESLALVSEPLQQRRGLPPCAVLLMKLADTFINICQAHGVRVPHRPAPISGKAITMEINNVDIHGTQRIPVLENTRAFVNERIDAALDDFFLGNFSLRDARLLCPFMNQLGNYGIGRTFAVFIVFIPACSRLLTEPAEL